MRFGYKCLLLLFDFMFVLSGSVNLRRSHRPANVALFTLVRDLSWEQFFIHKPIIFNQYVRFFESFLSLPHLVDI